MTQQKEEEMALNQASTKNIPVTKTSLHSLAHSLSTLFFFKVKRICRSSFAWEDWCKCTL